MEQSVARVGWEWGSATDKVTGNLYRLGSGQEDRGHLAAGVAVGTGRDGGPGARSEEFAKNQGLPTPWGGATPLLLCGHLPGKGGLWHGSLLLS